MQRPKFLLVILGWNSKFGTPYDNDYVGLATTYEETQYKFYDILLVFQSILKYTTPQNVVQALRLQVI